MEQKQLESLLLTVQKPGRYSGGEINSVIKDKTKVDVRLPFAFPISMKSACPTLV